MFSLTCEGFLLQTNTSSLGEQNRFIADNSGTPLQAPIYFDPQSRATAGFVAGDSPLICKVVSGKLACFVAAFETKMVIQYCSLYEEFFSAPILLAEEQGPQCDVLTAVVEGV